MDPFLNHTPSVSRQPRGSYSKLICLACRARKIKCILPDPIFPDASTSPGLQPPEKACTRCKAQALDCVVDRTVLGRPSGPKRARAEPATTAQGPETEATDADDDGGMQDFVLADVRSEVEAIGREAERARPKPSKHEIFLALVDSAHLFAALMEREDGFGRLVIGGEGRVGDVLGMVDLRTAKGLEKRLVWHRFFFPYMPTLFSLHKELSNLEPGALHADVTATLFALLCLIALDVPANGSPQAKAPSGLAQRLQSFISHHAPNVLFDLPIHRHMLLILELALTYKPLALVSSRRGAASALKGNLYATLAKRTAEKLGLHEAPTTLSALLSSKGSDSSKGGQVQSLVLDSLLYCRTLMLEAILDGYIPKPIQEQRAPMEEIRKIVATVKWALELHALPVAVILLYHHLSTAEAEMLAAITGKASWQSLPALDMLITNHATSCEKSKAQLKHMLNFYADTSLPNHASLAPIIFTLRTSETNASHARIGGMSLFYSLMSCLHPPSSARCPDAGVTPEDALQVSDEIIQHIKHTPGTPDDPTAIFSFLKRHGDPRVEMLESTLRDFVSAADTLVLEGVPYVPPALPTAASLLFTARELVENNAARMKGWDGLHPNADVQILLLQDVALRLESRAGNPDQADAIAKGSVFASAAKLIRGLCKILAEWRRVVAEREAKEVVNLAEKSGEFAGVEEFLKEGDESGFDDWSDWPTAQGVNWGDLFADGTEWAEWASALLPAKAVRA